MQCSIIGISHNCAVKIVFRYCPPLPQISKHTERKKSQRYQKTKSQQISKETAHTHAGENNTSPHLTAARAPIPIIHAQSTHPGCLSPVSNQRGSRAQRDVLDRGSYANFPFKTSHLPLHVPSGLASALSSTNLLASSAAKLSNQRVRDGQNLILFPGPQLTHSELECVGKQKLWSEAQGVVGGREGGKLLTRFCRGEQGSFKSPNYCI